MTHLYHSFPGALSASRPRGLTLDQARGSHRYRDIALGILKLILKFGILLTPEPICIPPNPNSRLAKSGARARPLFQTRACFTAIAEEQLLQPQPKSAGDENRLSSLSHADLFGALSIGFDYRYATAFEFCPCAYVKRTLPREGSKAGTHLNRLGTTLSSDFVAALVEARELLVILSWIEANVPDSRNDHNLPTNARNIALLQKAGIFLSHQPKSMEKKILELVRRLPHSTASEISGLLNTDRRPLWQLVQMLDLQLELLQTADSKQGRALAYFCQSEFRIIKVLSENLAGFSLFPDIEIDTEDLWSDARRGFLGEFTPIRQQLGEGELGQEERSKYFVLVGANDNGEMVFFRDCIRQIVTPKEWLARITELISESESWRNFPLGQPQVIAV